MDIKQFIDECVSEKLMYEMRKAEIRRMVAEELKHQLNEKKAIKRDNDTKEKQDRKFYNDDLTNKAQAAYKVYPNMSKDAARSLFSKEFSDNNKNPRKPSETTVDKTHNLSK